MPPQGRRAERNGRTSAERNGRPSAERNGRPSAIGFGLLWVGAVVVVPHGKPAAGRPKAAPVAAVVVLAGGTGSKEGAPRPDQVAA